MATTRLFNSILSASEWPKCLALAHSSQFLSDNSLLWLYLFRWNQYWIDGRKKTETNCRKNTISLFWRPIKVIWMQTHRTNLAYLLWFKTPNAFSVTFPLNNNNPSTTEEKREKKKEKKTTDRGQWQADDSDTITFYKCQIEKKKIIIEN